MNDSSQSTNQIEDQPARIAVTVLEGRGRKRAERTRYINLEWHEDGSACATADNRKMSLATFTGALRKRFGAQRLVFDGARYTVESWLLHISPPAPPFGQLPLMADKKRDRAARESLAEKGWLKPEEQS